MRCLLRWFPIFCAALLFLCTTARADFNTAMKIYEEQRFEEAKTAFEVLAAIGDRESLFNLGVMYFRGEAAQRDPARAYALMFLANKDYDQKHLGDTVTKVYASFSEQMREEASMMIEELSPTYDIETVRGSIFPVLLDDKDCIPELRAQKKVAPRYPYAEQRNGQLGYTIAELTVSPQGYARDIYITRSVTRNFSRASAKATKQFRYAPPADGRPIYGHKTQFTFLLESHPGSASKIKSPKLRKELDQNLAAAEAGDVIAQFRYGRSLSELRGLRESLEGMNLQYRDANLWFKKSANGGLPHAQFEIGKNMLEGRGCEVDREGGIKWIKAAAVSGHSGAQHLLAREITAKERTDQANLAAMSWLRNAAMVDYYPAKIHLAWSCRRLKRTICMMQMRH